MLFEMSGVTAMLFLLFSFLLYSVLCSFACTLFRNIHVSTEYPMPRLAEIKNDPIVLDLCRYEPRSMQRQWHWMTG